MDGISLWPFTLTLTTQAGRVVATASVSNISAIAPRLPAPINSNWLPLRPAQGAPLLPAGRYLVTMTAQSVEGKYADNGFWNGGGWLTDATPAPAAAGGAASATYTLEQLQARALPPLAPVRLRAKLKQAMAWALGKMRRRDGSLGIFVMDDGRFCGSNHSTINNSTWPSGRCWPGNPHVLVRIWRALLR